MTVQDHQPGTLARLLGGGLLGDHRTAQASDQRAGQPLDGNHGLGIEVGPAPQRSWLVVERPPAYAPELNPTEGLSVS